MFDWLIKLLGGYTAREYNAVSSRLDLAHKAIDNRDDEINMLKSALKKASKNDKRDPITGRFTK